MPFMPPMPAAPAGAPVGSVVAFVGDPASQSTPLATQGWLVCDGSPLGVAQYQELFSVIGYQYSSTSGGGTFNLPDLRGYFLRGVDPRTSGSNDPDSGSRKRADGTTGPVVGSVQECALQEHEHTYTPAVTAEAQPGGNGGSVGTGNSTTSQLTPDTVLTSPNETRPKNVYVYFIIKYTQAASVLLNPFPAQTHG
jgi:microcystin-dependent protein